MHSPFRYVRKLVFKYDILPGQINQTNGYRTSIAVLWHGVSRDVRLTN